MKPVFADSSFFLAFLNPRDINHEEAISLLGKLAAPLITTQWVLAEVGNALSRAEDRQLFLQLIEILAAEPGAIVLPADAFSFEAGLNLFRARDDKDWSFIDCTSMAVMTQNRITEVLTADRHFAQAGFNILMSMADEKK